MPRPKPPYPIEFRARMIELVRAGRSVRSLSKEFGVTETTIHSWVRQADRDSGRRKDGPTSDERQELTQLRKENARLREERDILEKAAAWFAQARVATIHIGGGLDNDDARVAASREFDGRLI